MHIDDDERRLDWAAKYPSISSITKATRTGRIVEWETHIRVCVMVHCTEAVRHS
jgi:hypothetical protein